MALNYFSFIQVVAALGILFFPGAAIIKSIGVRDTMTGGLALDY